MRRHAVRASALVVSMAACTGGSPGLVGSPSPLPRLAGPTRAFVQDGLAFRYPAGWVVQGFPDESSFTFTFVFVSTGRMRAPCVTTKRKGSTSQVCSQFARGHLRPGGITASWTLFGMPGPAPPTPVAPPGRPVRTVKGVAWLQIRRPGSCRQDGGDVTVDATIYKGSGETPGFELLACARAPHLESSLRRIESVLWSAHLVRGA